jgi:hypothetical protein
MLASSLSAGVIQPAPTPQDEFFIPQDKIPDPPAIPTPVIWFFIGVLCLGVFFIIKIYLVVLRRQWSLKTSLITKLLSKGTTFGLTMKKKDDDMPEEVDHGRFARSE